MKALLVGFALAVALTAGCSDVRVVDDDGDDGDDGAGGAASGLGGSGGGPSTEPMNARLFAAGWDGVHVWNDPDAGIARDADVLLPIEGARDLAIVGDRLCVLANDDLWIFDSVWDLAPGAEPAVVIDKNAASQSPRVMRALDDLDAVWADDLVFTSVSAIQSSAEPIQVGWHDPVYDAASDRLFVIYGFTVAVIESASQSTSFEPDWTLYDGDPGVNRLATDGVLLYAARSGSGGDFSDWKIATWQLSVTEPTPADGLNAGPPGEIFALHPIPGGGVVAAAEHSLYTWAIGPGDPQDPTAYLLTPEETWSGGAVSQARRIYSAGDTITVFADPTLGDAVDEAANGAHALALIER